MSQKKSPGGIGTWFYECCSIDVASQKNIGEGGTSCFILRPELCQDVRKLATQVQERVDQICQEHEVDQVDLIGLSQGGVIGLCYLKLLGGAHRVRRFIAVGAPIQGTAIASRDIGPGFGFKRRLAGLARE